MRILTEHGFRGNLLTPELANLLGDGADLIAEAAMTTCRQVEPVHILGLLAKRTNSILRADLLKNCDVQPERFCEILYDHGLEDDRPPAMPAGMGLESYADASLRIFQDFETAIVGRGAAQGTEALFLLVLLDRLDPSIYKLLVAMVGSEESLDRFRRSLDRQAVKVAPVEVFDKEGNAIRTAFDKSGWRILNMLREETVALGSTKVTALHLLYTVVGIEQGVLQRALYSQAIDPIREVHVYLSRELRRTQPDRAELELKRKIFHESVIKILERAAAEAQRHGARIGELQIVRSILASGVVADFLADRKIKLEVLRDYLAKAESQVEETEDHLSLGIRQIEDELHRRILGQRHAISQILPWIKRLRFGFPKDRGPAAVLLFLGPSGTGKTELAKQLARTVYGSEDDMIMLEMGQFNSKESINLFIGAPPGYIGYGEGKLTNGLRDKPRSVVLFDEVEKAHEDVWSALLRFLDEGLISDPAGPTRDGRKCIIVLTSNLGADTLGRLLPQDDEDALAAELRMEQAVREIVLGYLKRPEIYNRVDAKIMFRPLDAVTYRALIERQVRTETSKFADRGTRVETMDDVLDWLTERAAKTELEGARCVPRIVNKFVVSKVIDFLTSEDDHVPNKVVISKSASDTVAEEA